MSARPWLATLALACGCGSGPGPTPHPPAAPEPGSAGAESRVAPGSGAALRDDQEIRVQLAQLTLEPGGRFVPPTSRCQDVLVLVRGGRARATGPGIGTEREAATLEEGDAVRFGPSSEPSSVVGDPERGARLAVAFTRARGFGLRGVPLDGVAAALRAPPDDPACGEPEPAAPGSRVSSLADATPLVVAGGAMRVRILLDAERHGARHGGLSVLEADAEAAVPPHTHPESIEALIIERGAGTMPLGDARVPIRDGAIVYVPEATVHAFEPDGTTPLRAVQVYAPSGPEQRFRAMAAGEGP